MESDKGLLELMRQGETLRGYFVTLRGKECFFRTRATRRSLELAQRVLHRAAMVDNPTNRREVCYWGHFARCVVRKDPAGREYYDISGDLIGGRGTFVDDGGTILFDLTVLP